MWQTYIQPGGEDVQYTVRFQVWRPSTLLSNRGTRYDLVAENSGTGVSVGESGLVSIVVPPSRMILVQPGDVVGYYTFSRENEDHSRGEGILLDESFVDEEVWYRTFTRGTDDDEESERTLNPQTSSQYTVGLNDESDLNRITRAGPIISVDICE